MRVETNPTRETKNVSFRGSGHSSAKGRPSWVDRPPRGGETSRRRPLRRHRPGYRCKILLSGGGEQRGGGGGERKRERERDFNLHEAAVSSSGNYSAGLATREPRAWEDLLVEEEEEKKRANNAAGLRLRERKQPT